MPPQRANLVLASDVPHGEGNVLVLDGLDVEAWLGGELERRRLRETTWTLTDRRNGGDDLAELQLVQDGGLTGGIETDLIEGRIVSGATQETGNHTIRIPVGPAGQQGIGRIAWVRTHFLLAKEAGEQTRHRETHDGGGAS
jgi:hypothetical protein